MLTYGNKNNNSISKIKKIKAIIKNRKEKGIRLSSVDENPHSNDLLNSRSILILNLKINNKQLIIIIIIIEIKKNIININI